MATKFVTKYDQDGNPYLVPIEDDGTGDDLSIEKGRSPLRITVNPYEFKPGPPGTPASPQDENAAIGDYYVPTPPPDAGFAPPRSYEEDKPPLDDAAYVAAVRRSIPMAGSEPYGPPEADPSWLDSIDQATRSTRQLVKGALEPVASMPWNIAALASSVAGRTSPMAAVAPDAYDSLTDFLTGQGQQAQQGIEQVTGVGEPQNLAEQAYAGLGRSITPMGRSTPLATVISAVGNLGGYGASRAIGPTNAAPDPNAPPPSPVTVPVESVGGPTELSHPELAAIGVLGAVSLGMIFGPKVYNRFKSGAVPRLRSVRDAAPGTEAMSTPIDYARTVGDDANAGALRLFRRAGHDPLVVKQVEDAFRIQTRATANAMVDSAVNVGRMETPSFTFASKVPLAELAKMETPAARDYLHVMDTIDDIKAISINQLKQRHPQPGPIVVRGLDLQSATQIKNALEQSDPTVVDFSKAYQDIVKSVRRFQATGEYATLSRQEWFRRNNVRPNEVPWQGDRRTLGDPNVDRGSPSEQLRNHMRGALRDRIENEAKGLYVDNMRKAIPSTFRDVTATKSIRKIIGKTAKGKRKVTKVTDTNAPLRDNPNWEKNTVSIYHKGIKYHYTTDPFLADVLRMDPYYVTSMLGQVAHVTRRTMEMTTTGELAPHFAPISAIRNFQLSKVSIPTGRRQIGIVSTLGAIPRQLLPQLAHAVSQSLEAGSGGWLSSVFGQSNMDAMAQRLAYHYQNSLMYQLNTVGGGRGSIMEVSKTLNPQAGIMQAMAKVSRAIEVAAPPAKAMLETYRALLNALHNAPAFAYARKNVGRAPLPQLAAEARNLTGDPHISGTFLTKRPGVSRATPIRFENHEPTFRGRVSHAAGQALKVYGGAAEIARTTLPWANTTIQGVKRLGQAYLENPARFIGRIWLYNVAPTAAITLYTRALGKDPTGLFYSDYQNNRRSEYQRTMNTYIPIPGQPAPMGIEIPRFHEASIAHLLTEVAIDHAFRSNIFDESEDILNAANNFASVVLDPSMPPLGNAMLAKYGIVGPTGVFAGEAYTPKNEAFDQLGGLPKSIEMYIRALTPGFGDLVGSAAAAYTQTAGGVMAGLGNAAKAALRREVQKTPLVRDLFGIKAPAIGTNRISEEYYGRRKVLSELLSYYKTWTANEGLIGVRRNSKTGELAPSPGRSKQGGARATELLGERPPTQAAGLNQPEPTNPLYNMFIQELHTKFQSDTITRSKTDYRGAKGELTGGIGTMSVMDRASWLSEHINRLRKVNDGNMVTWQRALQAEPEQLRYLKANKVDPMKLNEVRNFYEQQRQNALRILLLSIRETEKDFSNRLGRKVTLEDIRPYGQGIETPSGDATQGE